MNPDNPNPVPSPASAASGATPAEKFLAAELSAARTSLQRTRIAGVIIIAVVLGYMTVVTRALKGHLEPKAAAEFATSYTSEQVLDKADALAIQVRERIPALVAELPDFVQRELPRYREALEDRIEQDFIIHCQTPPRQLGKHFDDFLQAHVVEIKALLKAADDKPGSLQALAPDMEKELLQYLSDKTDGDESLKDKIDHALVELRRVEKQVGNLARGGSLTPQEKKVRHAIAVIGRNAEEETRQLRMEIQDALNKAGK